MTYAIKLSNGKFLKDYIMRVPFQVSIESSNTPRYFNYIEAVDRIRTIANFADDGAKLISKEDMKKPKRNKKTVRRITAALGIERQLKEEGFRDPLDPEKIDKLRIELEGINQKIQQSDQRANKELKK